MQEPGFVDLLERCLRWDPAERITPEGAMSHPWVQEQIAGALMASAAVDGGTRVRPTRHDQAQPPAGLSAAAAKNPAGIAGGIAAAAAAVVAKATLPFSNNAGGGGGGSGGSLCSGELGSGSTARLGAPAAHAAFTGAVIPPVDAAAVASGGDLDARRSSNDTCPAGVDVTPRSMQQLLQQQQQQLVRGPAGYAPVVVAGNLSAAAPLVARAAASGRILGISMPHATEAADAPSLPSMGTPRSAAKAAASSTVLLDAGDAIAAVTLTRGGGTDQDAAMVRIQQLQAEQQDHEPSLELLQDTLNAQEQVLGGGFDATMHAPLQLPRLQY